MTAFDTAWALMKIDGPPIELTDPCLGCGGIMSEADISESEHEGLPFCWGCREMGHPDEAITEWFESMKGRFE